MRCVRDPSTSIRTLDEPTIRSVRCQASKIHTIIQSWIASKQETAHKYLPHISKSTLWPVPPILAISGGKATGSITGAGAADR